MNGRGPRAHALVTASDVPAILDDLGATESVALDTEFHPERRYLPQLYLVQIATPRGPWLFDPLEPEPLLEIGPALRARPWIVHSGLYDLRLLERAIGGIAERVIDVQIAAGLTGPDYPAPLGGVLQQRLGVHLPKTETLSDWSKRPLSREQLAYAADDVLQLHRLWEVLRDDLAQRDRLAIAEAAFAEARLHAIDPDLGDLWREIGGSATLDPRGATILKALAAWRDEAARAEDQPPRVLLPDGVLLELARHAPSDAGVLHRDRRLSRTLVKRYSDALIAQIAGSIGSAPPPFAPRGSAAWRVATVLEAACEAAAAQARWAPRLVTPRGRLEAIAARVASSVSADSPIRASVAHVLGWRDALAGDLVTDVILGRRIVGCSGGDAFLDDRHTPR